MSEWIDKIAFLLKSNYLYYFWWLVFAGYLLTYGIAFVLADRVDKGEETILYRCRTAWSYAFLFHALLCGSVAYYWFAQNGLFNTFWRYLPFYLLLIGIDISFAFVLLLTRSKYRRYVS